MGRDRVWETPNSLWFTPRKAVRECSFFISFLAVLRFYPCVSFHVIALCGWRDSGVYVVVIHVTMLKRFKKKHSQSAQCSALPYIPHWPRGTPVQLSRGREPVLGRWGTVVRVHQLLPFTCYACGGLTLVNGAILPPNSYSVNTSTFARVPPSQWFNYPFSHTH